MKTGHLFIATHEWGDMWRAQQPLCNALAEAGEHVLYTTCDTSFLRALNPRQAQERQRLQRWWSGERRGVHPRRSNVDEYFPPPLWHLGTRFPALLERQVETVGRLARRCLPAQEAGDGLYVWIDNPFGARLKRVFPRARVLGYMSDDIRPFPHVHFQNVEWAERRLAQTSDAMIGVTCALRDRYAVYGATALLSRVGAPAWVEDPRYDAPPTDQPDWLRDIPRPILGFIGSIAPWLDLAILRQLAQRFAHASLFVAGPLDIPTDADWQALDSMPNVFLRPGRIPYNSIPLLLQHFDVCLLPFLKVPLMAGADPGKMYEYMGVGKPTVAIRVNEDMERYRDLAYLAETAEVFTEQVGRALNETPDDPRQAARRAFAKNQTWARTAERLRGELRARFGM